MNKSKENIALFPLNLLLLPGDYMQLYIFEERYKQLIHDCRTLSMNFGIAFSNKTNNFNIGTLVEVMEVLKVHPKGEMDVIVRAISLFRLDSFSFQKEGKLYPGGEVEVLENLQNTPVEPKLLIRFKEYLLKDKALKNDVLEKKDIGIFDVANELYLSEQEKLEFIELPNDAERNLYLHNYINYLEILESQEKSIYEGIYLN